ncbi:MAG TPA: hypothetical protein VGK87_08295, partial [Anaerolineae bacterium]
MQRLSNLLARRRATYSVLIGIILLTLPCYILGALAMAIAPRDNVATSTPRPTATLVILATANPNATATLADVPTVFVPPTRTPSRSTPTRTP